MPQDNSVRGVWKVSTEMQQHSNAKVIMWIDTSVQYVHAYIHKCANSNSCKCFDDGHVHIFILYCSLLGLVIVSAIRTHASMSSSPCHSFLSLLPTYAYRVQLWPHRFNVTGMSSCQWAVSMQKRSGWTNVWCVSGMYSIAVFCGSCGFQAHLCNTSECIYTGSFIIALPPFCCLAWYMEPSQWHWLWALWMWQCGQLQCIMQLWYRAVQLQAGHNWQDMQCMWHWLLQLFQWRMQRWASHCTFKLREPACTVSGSLLDSVNTCSLWLSFSSFNHVWFEVSHYEQDLFCLTSTHIMCMTACTYVQYSL